MLSALLGTGTPAPSIPNQMTPLDEQQCGDNSLLTLLLPGFNCAYKSKPEASEASLRQSQRQGDFRLWPQSSLRSPLLCPAATTVSEPAGVLHISYVQQSGGTMEQIMNKLRAELWNSSLCEPPSQSAGTAGPRGTRGWGHLNSRRPARVPYLIPWWQH